MARKFTESLVCDLTPREIAESADTAARAARQRDDIQRDIDEKKKTAKAAVEKHEGEIKYHLERVRTKQGFRPVECIEEPVYVDGLMVTTRLDTGEVVRSRELTEAERQVPLISSEKRAEA